VKSGLMRCHGNRLGEQRLVGLPAAPGRVSWEQREPGENRLGRRQFEEACHDAG
jgi:hypothetical protein